MDSVRSGPYGQIFRPDNFVFGQVLKRIHRTSSHTAAISACAHGFNTRNISFIRPTSDNASCSA